MESLEDSAITDALAREVLEHAPVVLLVLRADGRIEYGNPFLQRLLGRSLRELRGQDWFDTWVPGGERALIREVFRAAMDGASVHGVVNDVRTASGERRTIEWASSRLMRGDTPAALLSVGHDVTDRLRLVERLAHSQRVGRLGSWEMDEDGVACWSDVLRRMLGVSEGEARVGFEAYLQAVHPDDRHRVRRAHEAGLAQREGFDIEHRLLHADGAVVHVRSQVRFPMDGDGELAQVRGTLLDVTDLTVAGRRLRLILDSLPTFVGVFDLQGRVLEANSASLGVAGLQRLEVLGQPFWQTPWWGRHPASQQRLRELLAAAAAGETVRDRLELSDVRQQVRVIDASFGPLLGPDGSVEGTVGSAVDITERLQAESDARRTAELLRTVVDNAPLVAFVLDREGTFLLSEGQALEQLGLESGQVVGMRSQDLYADVPGYVEVFKQALDGSSARLANTVAGIDFEAVYVPTFDEEGQVTAVVGVGLDVTARVAAERAQARSEQKLRLALTVSGLDPFEVDADGGVEAGAFASSVLDALRTALRGDSGMVHPDDLERLRASYEQATGGARDRFALDLRVGNGGWRWVRITGQVVERDDVGGMRRVLGVVADIDAEKQAALVLRDALRAKEMLLREVHHRVKNNLQVISSLLFFQADRAEALEHRDVLEELRQRLFAMTLVHERLYQAADSALVDISEYIGALVDELRQSHVPGSAVEVHVEVVSIGLPIEVAMPLGMLICELFTNALKHAFAGRSRGRVEVIGRRVGADALEVVVRDDGVGLPADLEPKRTQTFGYRLVRMLVRQLGGQLRVASVGGGVAGTVRFPLERGGADEGVRD